MKTFNNIKHGLSKEKAHRYYSDRDTRRLEPTTHFIKLKPLVIVTMYISCHHISLTLHKNLNRPLGELLFSPHASCGRATSHYCTLGPPPGGGNAAANVVPESFSALLYFEEAVSAPGL